MARALEEQRHAEAADHWFEDRLAMLVEREALERDVKRLAARLRFAGLRQQATPEDVNQWAARGLGQAFPEADQRRVDRAPPGPVGNRAHRNRQDLEPNPTDLSRKCLPDAVLI